MDVKTTDILSNATTEEVKDFILNLQAHEKVIQRSIALAVANNCPAIFLKLQKGSETFELMIPFTEYLEEVLTDLRLKEMYGLINPDLIKGNTRALFVLQNEDGALFIGVSLVSLKESL